MDAGILRGMTSVEVVDDMSLMLVMHYRIVQWISRSIKWMSVERRQRRRHHQQPFHTAQPASMIFTQTHLFAILISYNGSLCSSCICTQYYTTFVVWITGISCVDASYDCGAYIAPMRNQHETNANAQECMCECLQDSPVEVALGNPNPLVGLPAR